MGSEPCYFCCNHLFIHGIFVWYFPNYFLLINHFSQLPSFVFVYVRVFHYLGLDLEKFLETSLHKITIVFCSKHFQKDVLVFYEICTHVAHVASQSFQQGNWKYDILHGYFLGRYFGKEQKVFFPLTIGYKISQHHFLFLSAKGCLYCWIGVFDCWELMMYFLKVLSHAGHLFVTEWSESFDKVLRW